MKRDQASPKKIAGYVTIVGFTDLFQTLEDTRMATAPIIVTCYCRRITLRSVHFFYLSTQYISLLRN